MKGQMPNDQDQCYCEKEGKWARSINFYTYKDGSKSKMCKQCLTMHINNFEPNTFLWLLEDFDVPYVPAEWNTLRDRAFAKDPKKMNGMSVFGKYLSKMKLKQWKEYGWADTERLKALNEEKARVKTAEEEKADAETERELKEKLANGEISEAEYKTLMPAPTLYEDQLATPSSLIDQQVSNPYQEDNFMSEDELPDPAADLTKDDKKYLAMKWGRLYKPNEWIQLEKDYNDMMNSFDIQDADTKNTLILICKTNLKMNQAIDMGDIDGALKHSRMYDTLRKSAKLTAAQNKEEKSEFIDSVGELVAYCEKNGGQIPKYEIKAPYDVIDQVITDLKDYTKSLVYSDTALSRQIEDYLKNRTILDQARRDEEEAKAKGLEAPEVTDKDIADYNAEIEKQKDADAAVHQSDSEDES